LQVGRSLACEAVADDPAGARVDVQLRVHAEIDDLGEGSRQS
jgi:hypothetical protein